MKFFEFSILFVTVILVSSAKTLPEDRCTKFNSDNYEIYSGDFKLSVKCHDKGEFAKLHKNEKTLFWTKKDGKYEVHMGDDGNSKSYQFDIRPISNTSLYLIFNKERKVAMSSEQESRCVQVDLIDRCEKYEKFNLAFPGNDTNSQLSQQWTLIPDYSPERYSDRKIRSKM